jgi:hypothetical protein
MLVLADLELAAAKKLPEVRRVLLDTVLLVALALAGLGAAGAFTWAAVRAVGEVAGGWRAPLLVGLGWLSIAAGASLLARRALRRREPGGCAGLALLFHERHHDRAVQERRRERERADKEIRSTAEALVGSAGHEVLDQELDAARTRLKEEVADLGGGGDEVVDEILAALLAPARISRSLLTKIRGEAGR